MTVQSFAKPMEVIREMESEAKPIANEGIVGSAEADAVNKPTLEASKPPAATATAAAASGAAITEAVAKATISAATTETTKNSIYIDNILFLQL